MCKKSMRHRAKFLESCGAECCKLVMLYPRDTYANQRLSNQCKIVCSYSPDKQAGFFLQGLCFLYLHICIFTQTIRALRVTPAYGFMDPGNKTHILELQTKFSGCDVASV
jgi:hypothetical protein